MHVCGSGAVQHSVSDRVVCVAFYYLNKDMMKITTIRPRLEYAEIVWSLHTKITDTGEDTKNSTKMIPELGNLTFEE